MADLSNSAASLISEKPELLQQGLKEGRDNVPRAQIEPLKRDTNTFPVSFAQQRQWFLDRLEPGNPIYNNPYAFHLTGSLNIAALERSINEIVRRHEILRTNFSVVEGQPVQVIAPTLAVKLQLVDCQELPEVEQEAEIQRLATENAQRPFNLAQGPLLSSTLLRLGEKNHVLFVTIHHIVTDHWSIGLLFKEISILYETFSIGQPSPLFELPIQYADFAVWQRQILQGEFLETYLSYWKKQLSGAPAVLELPTDHPRPPTQTFRGAMQSLVLSKTLVESLKTLGQQEGVTSFMILLAAFKILLYRYTGQDDIVIGIPIAGRNRSEIENLIGFFLNTLVLRTDLSGHPTFRELLARVREVALGAYAHQDLPFEKLVEELQPKRDLSRTPLFQVFFNMYNFEEAQLELPGLAIERFLPFEPNSLFDLTLYVREHKQDTYIKLEYNADLFDPATINRMAGHFQTLLEGIVADPEAPISQLPLLTEAERHQMLVAWNDTQADYPKDVCVHELFEAQVERTPEAMAVVFEDQQLTYRQLNTRANQLAHYLRKRGVGPEVLVGICVERSLELVVGLLGILKAGGAYVPLDPSYPPERLAFMVEDSRMRLLLAQEQLLETLLTDDVQVICLDLEGEAIAQESVENLAPNITTNNLAYVIYTSGSTGRPKGAMIPHKAIFNHMMWMQTEFAFAETDRILQKTPMSFDASIWEFYAPLFAGGQLILARSDGHRDSNYLVKTIIDHEITTLQLVPSQLQMLLDAGGLENCHSLQRVYCGGEVLSVDLAHRFLTSLPSTVLYNLYGPTEAAIDTTFWQSQNEPNPHTVPIGRPIANAQIYLLDSNLCLVPIGVSGELHIGGVGVGRGYLNRPKLTAEKFIPDPYSNDSAARLYKTGDLVRYRPDGNIEFLGRIDHQVKIRGFRIELGEVEITLRQHPSVRESVALAREDVPGDKRLVAYVVSDQEQTPTSSELRDFLKRKLPEYMMPSAFVILDTLPLTPNGKIDRQTLPAPDQVRPELANTFVAPRTEAEEIIAEIWAELLGLEQVGIYDNFFELGGHSLLATQIISRLRDVFQIELPLRTLFEAPSVTELATLVEATRRVAYELHAPPDAKVGDREEIEL
jgi:amino acid adenylation domain-containing protein